MQGNSVSIKVEINDFSEKSQAKLASFFSGLAASLRVSEGERAPLPGGEALMAAMKKTPKGVGKTSYQEKGDKELPAFYDCNDEVKIGPFTYRRMLRDGKESFMKLGGKRPAFMTKSLFEAKTKGKKLQRTWVSGGDEEKKTPPRKRKAKKAKSGRRARRTPEQLERQQGVIIKVLREENNLTMEELADRTRTPPGELSLPLKKLIEGGWVRKSGNTRATTYSLTRKKWSK